MSFTRTKSHYKLLERIEKKKRDERIQKLAHNFVPRVNLTELSRATGVCKSTLSRILCGTRHQSGFTLLLVAAALGINLEDFLVILEIRRLSPKPKKKKTPQMKVTFSDGEKH